MDPYSQHCAAASHYPAGSTTPDLAAAFRREAARRRILAELGESILDIVAEPESTSPTTELDIQRIERMAQSAREALEEL